MSEPTFTAMLAIMNFCASGAPMDAQSSCNGEPPNTVEMRVLGGNGLCPDWDCAADVSVLIEIKRDGAVLLSVPAGQIDADTLAKLWVVMKPAWRP